MVKLCRLIRLRHIVRYHEDKVRESVVVFFQLTDICLRYAADRFDLKVRTGPLDVPVDALKVVAVVGAIEVQEGSFLR